MFVAHLLLGALGGLATAVYAGLAADASLWSAVLVYAVAGNLVCLGSVVCALLVAARASGAEQPLAPGIAPVSVH